jgi:hypothetical protein
MLINGKIPQMIRMAANKILLRHESGANFTVGILF